jgi:hypothetical protein
MPATPAEAIEVSAPKLFPFDEHDQRLVDLVLAITTGTGLAKLSAVIHAYPAQAEIIEHLGDACLHTKATPSVLDLLRSFFRWRQ